jgi:hypothetical protein
MKLVELGFWVGENTIHTGRLLSHCLLVERGRGTRGGIAALGGARGGGKQKGASHVGDRRESERRVQSEKRKQVVEEALRFRAKNWVVK